MRTTTAGHDTRAQAGQSKPVELIDFFLGSQVTDDADTLHFALYDKNIDFFDIDGNAQTYIALPAIRSSITHNMELKRDTITVQLDNVDDAFMSAFWADARHMQDKRFIIRQLFTDLTTGLGDALVIIDGLVDIVSMVEKNRTCQVVISTFLGFIGFSSGVPLDRICGISVFANARCGQGVSPITKLTQEANDNIDVGSTTTSIVVKTLAQANDFWNVGRMEFTSAANDGFVRKITDWVLSTKTFTIDFPVPNIPAEDDTITVKRDCDRTLKMCRERYTEVHATDGNSPNFRGYNTIPTSVNPS